MTTDLDADFMSVSKTLIAATIQQLVQADLLGYGDSVGQLLPAQGNIPPEITVEQPLAHRSGLLDYGNDNTASFIDETVGAVAERIWSLEDLIETFVGSPTGSPGDPFSYSNTNSVVLAQIIEAISGRPFHLEVRDRLLDPLGLDATHWAPWEAGNRQRVSGFGADGTVSWRPTWSIESFLGPAGGVISTAADMAAWGRGLFAGTAFSAEAQERMLRRNSSNPPAESPGLQERGVGQGAFTFRLGSDTVVGHEGRFGGHSQTMLSYSDDEDLSVSAVVHPFGPIPSARARLTRMLLNVASGSAGAIADR